MAEAKKRAPTLYAIILIKLGKGSLLLLAALWIFSLADDNLTQDFLALLHWIRLDPEREFFVVLADKIAHITPANVYAVAAGTAFYSVFSLVEGVGLIFRISWAGWMAIGESVFFIPIEIYKLMHRYTNTVFVILILNVAIFWYLLQNRHRLFHHFRQASHVAHAPGSPGSGQPASAPPPADADIEI